MINLHINHIVMAMTWMTKNTLTYGLLFLIAGCVAAGTSATSFPIVSLKYRHGTKPVNLAADYAYIIDWPENRPPSFYIFNKNNRTRIKINHWDHFLSELSRLPQGIQIDSIGKCTVSFAYGMPDENKKQLNQVLEDQHIKRVRSDDYQSHVSFCYCETIDFQILYDEER